MARTPILRQAVLAAMSLWAATAPAAGQRDPAGLRITAAEHAEHVLVLGFDEIRHSLADSCFDAYEDEFDDAIEVREQVLQWMWSNSPDSDPVGGYDAELEALIIAEYRGIDGFLQTELRRLEQRYFADLGDLEVGDGGQVEALRRRHLRTRLMRAEAVAWDGPYGAALDVCALVDRCAPDHAGEEAIAGLLLEYELQLDAILIALDETSCNHSNRLRRMIREARDAVGAATEGADHEGEVERVAEFFGRPYMLRIRIRDLGRATVDAIAARLPDEQTERVRYEAQRNLAGYMYEANVPPVREMIERGLENPQVTEDQRAVLLALREAFTARESAALAQLEPIYEQMISPAMYRASFRQWAMTVVLRQRPEDPCEELEGLFDEGRARWRATCREYAEQVQGVLDAPQREPGR
jgi:hypothetical protein